mgnify:CR=1 FL=1
MSRTGSIEEYTQDFFYSARGLVEWDARAQAALARMHRGFPVYSRIERMMRVKGRLAPWWLTAIIHEMECDCDMNGQIANGWNWRRSSRWKPVVGPFDSFEASCVAIYLNPEWEPLLPEAQSYFTAGGVLRWLEEHNGGGYLRRAMRSQFLWSGSSLCPLGGWDSDGHFNPSWKSEQIGAAMLLRGLIANRHLALGVTPSAWPMARLIGWAEAVA